jgi:uncharacterized membrane protein YeaQ/YmgE (transglycosylase-associated protein family)
MNLLANLVAWVLFGALAGWLTAHIMHLKTDFWSNILIGICGAILGGALVMLLGGDGLTGFNVYSLIVSVIGGCFFTWIVRKVGTKGVTK